MPSTLALRARRGAALAVLLLLLLTACGGGKDKPATGGDTSTPIVLGVTVRGGSVVSGASRQKATLNRPVTIRVTSDAADEVHVHGYNKMFDVGAGQTGEVTFVANIAGVYEVEFEKSGKLLFTLEVR